jgi:hypothetical protein
VAGRAVEVALLGEGDEGVDGARGGVRVEGGLQFQGVTSLRI